MACNVQVVDSATDKKKVRNKLKDARVKKWRMKLINLQHTLARSLGLKIEEPLLSVLHKARLAITRHTNHTSVDGRCELATR